MTISEIEVGREYAQIMDFWFRELTPRQWFAGGPELDAAIRRRFGALLDQAKQGMLDAWAISPRGRLALIILLDQFSRNIFRGTPDAYAGDAKAQKLAREGIQAHMDEPLTFAERQFFYMPLMHAENAELQALSVEKFSALRDEAEAILGFATGHSAVVQRFGRFPQRNAALGRDSSAEEKAFLASNKGNFS